MDDGLDDLVRALEDAGCKVTGKRVNCAFHGDRNPSGEIRLGKDGRWRFTCHACGVHGDAADIIAHATQRPLAEVLRERREREAPQASRATRPATTQAREEPRWPSLDALIADFGARVVAVYRYAHPQTAAVELAVLRLEGKSFPQATPAPGGGWWRKGATAPLPIYHRAEIAAVDRVVVVEGEKDADALTRLGFPATTAPMGADSATTPVENDGKPGRADWTPLAGKSVVLWGDDDEPGRRHMQRVARILARLQPRPRIALVERSMLCGAKDAADFIVDQSQTSDDAARAAVAQVLVAATPLAASAPLAARIEAAIAGRLVAVPWPWASVGGLTQALMPGAVSLIVGAPGASKSFLVLQAVLWWLEHGYRTCLFELEEDPAFWQHRALALLDGNGSLTDPAWVAANADRARSALARCDAAIARLADVMTAAPADGVTLPDLAAWIERQATAGARIIVADPLTAAGVGDAKPWIAAQEFMGRAKRAACSAGASLVFTTHSRKEIGRAKGPPDLDALAGGAAFARFSSAVLWLEALHEPQVVQVVDADGMERSAEINRRLRILKAREGRGTGLSLGLRFCGRSLRTTEVGVVVTDAAQARRAGSRVVASTGRDRAAGDG